MRERLFKHTNAYKLDDPERCLQVSRAEVLECLELRQGMKVADIGTGTGYFAIPMASAVGATGHVYAVDLQPELLERFRHKLMQTEAVPTISLLQADATRTTLADGSVDLVFFSYVWHELEDHHVVAKEAARILAPEGRIAVLDWRPEAAPPPGPIQQHRIAPSEVDQCLSANGLRFLSSTRLGPFSYLLLSRAE